MNKVRTETASRSRERWAGWVAGGASVVTVAGMIATPLLPQGGRLSLAQQAATALAADAAWWRGVVGTADAAVRHSAAVSDGSAM